MKLLDIWIYKCLVFVYAAVFIVFFLIMSFFDMDHALIITKNRVIKIREKLLKKKNRIWSRR